MKMPILTSDEEVLKLVQQFVRKVLLNQCQDNPLFLKEFQDYHLQATTLKVGTFSKEEKSNVLAIKISKLDTVENKAWGKVVFEDFKRYLLQQSKFEESIEVNVLHDEIVHGDLKLSYIELKGLTPLYLKRVIIFHDEIVRTNLVSDIN